MSFGSNRSKGHGRECEPPQPEPLAYFLTWSTYGTWLPGDQRGWVLYRRGMQSPDAILERQAKARMKEDACRLDEEERRLVELTICDHCRVRGWTLHAVNCRSNHVHVVVAATVHDPNTMREQFKAWCTRRLKELLVARRRQITLQDTSSDVVRENWWAERGSGLYVNDEDGLQAVIDYVQLAQDSPRDRTHACVESGPDAIEKNRRTLAGSSG